MVAMHPEIEKVEVDALCELFHALDGPQWTRKHGWLQCDNTQNEQGGLAWHGTKWNKGHVISIDLPRNNLRGPLPDIFSQLKKLQHLNLGGNPSLTGRVPHSLMKLKHLQYCYLDGTQVFDIVSSGNAHDFHITKYISSSKASVRLRIGKSTWVADVTEQEMFLVSTSLQAARAPPRPTVIKMTAHNATGPERVRAARTLQRIFRRSRARRKLLHLGKGGDNVSASDEVCSVALTFIRVNQSFPCVVRTSTTMQLHWDLQLLHWSKNNYYAGTETNAR
ncbi:hypothetical protein, variant 1, partial [Aphanomyces invadans]